MKTDRTGEKERGGTPAGERVPPSRVLVVSSGKGGVGKTSFSVNLATEMGQRGARVILIDADLGLANAHILMGCKPKCSLTEYIEGQAALDDVISDTPFGVKLVSSGQGVQRMANLEEAGRKLVLDAIRDLRAFCDLLIIDTGAGISNTVTDFVQVADRALIVTNANFAAVANAYGLVKVMVQGGYANPVHVIVNRSRSPEEAKQVFRKLRECAEQFLQFPLQWLGLIPEDTNVGQAVQRRTPFSQLYPKTVATQYLKKIADCVEQWTACKVEQGK